jgi:hypothetical protein
MTDYLLIAVVLSFVVVSVVGGVISISFWSKHKQRRLARLKDSHMRLRTVVAELLERVNDLDEQLKYRSDMKGGPEDDKLKVAAKDLVTVTECLPTIQELLADKRLNDGADMLSGCCRVVEKVTRLLDQIQPAIQITDSTSGSTLKLPMKEKKIK